MKRKALVLLLTLALILSCSGAAFAKGSGGNGNSDTEKSPAAPAIANSILKEAGIPHVYKTEGEKPGNLIADVAREMGSSTGDLNGSWFQGIGKFDLANYLNAIKNYLLGIGAPLEAVAAEDFGVMDISNVIGYTVGFGFVNATASDADLVVIELYKGTTLLGTLTSSGALENYPDAVQLSGPFDVKGSFDYEADGNWDYGDGWLGATTDVPDKAVITVTFTNGSVWTATNTNLTGDTSIVTGL